jgi:cation diffusion facilitator family transporter
MNYTRVDSAPRREDHAEAMDECCQAKSCEISALRERQGRVLVAVLLINAMMFGVELTAGLAARSTALLGDSLDMLGDALVYGFSLYVLHRSAAWRARAAALKGIVMLAFGVGVLVEATWRLRTGVVPEVPIMASIGVLALAANTICFLLLWRHRSDDLNLRSTWLCSRNDLISNSAVLAAAAFVAQLQSLWPDLLVGVGIALLFLRSAVSVLRESMSELASTA